MVNAVVGVVKRITSNQIASAPLQVDELLEADIDEPTELGDHRKQHDDLRPSMPEGWDEAAAAVNAEPMPAVPEPVAGPP